MNDKIKYLYLFLKIYNSITASLEGIIVVNRAK